MDLTTKSYADMAKTMLTKTVELDKHLTDLSDVNKQLRNRCQKALDQLKLLVGNPVQRRTCCVCYTQDRTHCFIPCGHAGYCEGCAQRGVRRGRCFQCRGDIERAFRVYV